MELLTLDNGSMAMHVETENLNMLMEAYIMEAGMIIKNRALVSIKVN